MQIDDYTCIESLYPNLDTHKGPEDKLSLLPYPVERNRNDFKSISNAIGIPCKRWLDSSSPEGSVRFTNQS